MKRFLFIAIIVLPIILGGRASVAMDPIMLQQNPLIGTTAPDFSLSDLSGKTYSLSASTKNKRAILFFWATWCPHCRTQIKEIQTSQQQIQAKNIEMILIDVAEDSKQVANYLSRNGLSLPVLMDRQGATAERYNVMGMPTFVFINNQGVVTSAIHHLPNDYENYF